MVKKHNILLWHWGRRGGGPKYTLELSKELSKIQNINLFLSISNQCEIINDFQNLDVELQKINTYYDLFSCLKQSLKLPMLRKEFWGFVEHNKISMIICTMSHIWNIPILIGRNKKIFYCIVCHDATPHKGDNFFLREYMLKKEIINANQVITLTNYVKNIIEDDLNIDIPKNNVIPHGVFSYTDKKKVKVSKRKKILFFGRILPYKGLNSLLVAYKKIKKINKNVTLEIAGPGNLSKYEEKLSKLDDVYIKNSWIEEDEIKNYFKEAYIVVLPYIEASQSGVIPIAYSNGIPVVVTPVGGLKEQVINNETGIICKDIDPVSLFDGIIKLINNENLYASCVKGSLKYVDDHLSWTNIAQKFSNVIENSLKD